MTALETVEAFIARWKTPNGVRDAVRACFTPDCIYENIGVSRTIGPKEAIGFFEAFSGPLPFVNIDVDMLAIAANGNTVLTERVDYLKAADGETLIAIPLMGVFKVSRWQDQRMAGLFRSATGAGKVMQWRRAIGAGSDSEA